MNLVVIDDEPVIGSGVARMAESLCSDWHAVGVYTDAQDALELCDWDNVQVVLADISMPQMSGLEMLGILQQRGYPVQVIFITAYANFEYARAAVHLQALDYLLKPVSRSDLENALRKAQAFWAHKRAQENDESYLRDNLDSLRFHFLSDLLFEEHRLSEAAVAQSVQRFLLADAAYTLLLLYIPDDIQRCRERLQRDFPAGKNGMPVWFFYGGGLPSCVILALTEQPLPQAFLGALAQDSRCVCAGTPVRAPQQLPEVYHALLQQMHGRLQNETTEDAAVLPDPLAERTFSAPVALAVQYIRQNYVRRLSLKSIAEQVYLHPTYLSNLFKKQTGFTVIDYINYYRVLQAQKMLQQPGSKIYWVMEQVGFVNERYFSEVFKKEVGLTPTQYRQNAALSGAAELPEA